MRELRRPLAEKRLAAGTAIFLASTALALANLTWERSIPLPSVEGRIDHFSIDAGGHRLFLAALGNNTVEVIDLAAGTVVHSIAGLKEPQGVFFLPELNRVYVANGGDGQVRIFDGGTYAPVGSVKLDDDADNVRYDDRAKLLYAGHGSGALGGIDVNTSRLITDVKLDAHPESFQLEKDGSRAFVNVPNAHHIAVVDRKQKKVIATWSVGLAAGNFPMALDEKHHRLFIGCRMPARPLVFDTQSGREIAKLTLHGDCDDLFFDPAEQQLYASCGEGFIDVFSQIDADHYVLKEAIPTAIKARTCFLDGDELYLAVPKRSDRPAEVRCYRIKK